MSRIDISVREKESGELIANRGFCRSSHLSFFCEDSQDSKLREFAGNLFIGITITEDNVKDFVESLKYIVSYLEGLDKDEYEKLFSGYPEASYSQFLSDLKDGITFIQSLNEEQDLYKLEVDIA
jgi:DNA-dependent RNA polymerase auxiliary subunit epsilon